MKNIRYYDELVAGIKPDIIYAWVWREETGWIWRQLSQEEIQKILPVYDFVIHTAANNLEATE